MLRMSVRAKLAAGFAVAMAVVVATGFLTLGLNKLRNEAFVKYEEVQNAVAFLEEKEKDHLVWTEKLAHSIITVSPFTAELDPTQCSFGRWIETISDSYIYGLLRPETKQMLVDIKTPHSALHQSARGIMAAMADEGGHDQAAIIYSSDTTSALREVRQVFADIKADALLLAQETKAELDRLRRVQQIVVFCSVILSILISTPVAFSLTRSISRSLNHIIRELHQLGEGNLAERSELKTGDEFESLCQTLSQVKDKLSGLVSSMQNSSYQVAVTTESLAATSQQTSASIEEVAATTSEFSDTVRQTAEAAKDMLHQARAAQEQAEQGQTAVGEVVANIRTIDESTETMSETISQLDTYIHRVEEAAQTIHSIADQINMLALNATIEAARAGASGRGFAVVAEEVRKLAEASNHSVKEISGTVQKMSEAGARTAAMAQDNRLKVKEGTVVILNAGEAFQTIVSSVESMVKGMEDVGEKVRYLDNGASTIAVAMQEQSSASQEVAANVTTLTNLATGLDDELRSFRIKPQKADS